MYRHTATFYGGALFIDDGKTDPNNEKAKFKLIPVKLLRPPDLQITDPNTIYENSIAPVQSAYDDLKQEYTTLDDSLFNIKVKVPDAAARAGHVQNTLNQVNNTHTNLEKNAVEMEAQTYQSDESLLGLQKTYYEIRDVTEPGLRSRENQLATHVSNIKNKNIPDLKKMSELAENRMINTETVHVPTINNDQNMLEYDISEIKRKSKIDLNNLTVHAIKGHFPDIKRYTAGST